MARVNNLSNFLTDVASAIKTKKGSETAIPAANFDTEILALPSQGVYQTKVVTVTQNGQTVITPDTGYDAMDGVQVTVNIPEKQLQTKSYNFTTNQTIELLPDTGYDGFDTVTLNINVPPTRQTVKKFTTTDELNADIDKQDGDFATVLDDVPIRYSSNSIIFKEWYLPTQVRTGLISQTLIDGQVFIYNGEEDVLPENNEYVDVELGPTICSFRIYDGNNITKATIIYHSEDGQIYDLDASSVPHFRFLRNMKYNSSGNWNGKLVWFLYYTNNSFKGIYKYEKPYTMMDTFDRTKILLGDYANAIITSTDITIPTDPQNYILLETVMEFFSKCEEWSILTPGTEPPAYNDIFITLDSTKNIIKGYTRVVNRTDYWEFQGIMEFAYSSNQSYVCGYRTTEMKTFTYNLITKEFTVSDWTYDADVGNYQGMLFNDTYIIGNVYSMSYGFDKGYYYFRNYDDNYTKRFELAFPTISVPTYGALLSASDFTATNGDVVEGKQFLNPQGVLDTGVMQVLRYPYPYSEYHNYDYECYTANSVKQVTTRPDSESYVLASYQVVPGSQPDTWALTANRKMKLGVPYGILASAIGLTADKIKAGVTILGITGTYTGE